VLVRLEQIPEVSRLSLMLFFPIPFVSERFTVYVWIILS
jgi:hypothetical protein